MPSSPDPLESVVLRTPAYFGEADGVRVPGELLITPHQVLFYAREDTSRPAFSIDRYQITLVEVDSVRGKPRLSVRTPLEKLELWVPDRSSVEEAGAILGFSGSAGLGRRLSRVLDGYLSRPLWVQFGIPILGLTLALLIPTMFGRRTILGLAQISIVLLWFLRFRHR